MSVSLEDYDNTDRVISSTYWRDVLGLHGKTHDSDWAQFRRDIGMVQDGITDPRTGKPKPTGYRFLTKREALLLLIRSRWLKVIRHQIGVSTVKAKDLTPKEIAKYANIWLATVDSVGHTDDIRVLLHSALNGSLTGSQLSEVICAIVGKPMSEDTIRRWCKKEGVTYLRSQKMHPRQVRKMIRSAYSRVPIEQAC